MIVLIIIILIGYLIYKHLANKPLKGYSRKDFNDVRNGKFLNIDEKYREKIYDDKIELDRILEKISEKGVESISIKEKEFLNKISKK